MNYIIFNFHPIQMSINDLPNGLFTHGSIQVRANSGVVSSEPNQLPSLIVPYLPNNVIVRRNRMTNNAESNYTVTATCDIGSDVRLEYFNLDAEDIIPIDEIEIGPYGRFTHTFDTPTAPTNSFYLSMTNGELSGRSDVPVILTIEASVSINWQNGVELIPLTFIEGEVEVSLDGGITWGDWTDVSDPNQGYRIVLQDGLYLQGSIQTRRRKDNQVGDALPLGYSLIVPYQPLVTNIIRTAPMNYTIHGISIPNTEVEYLAFGDLNPVEVNEYGMFTITLENYSDDEVVMRVWANNNDLPAGFIEVELT